MKVGDLVCYKVIDGDPDLSDRAIITKVVEKSDHVEYYVNWVDNHGSCNSDYHVRYVDELHLISEAP